MSPEKNKNDEEKASGKTGTEEKRSRKTIYLYKPCIVDQATMDAQRVEIEHIAKLLEEAEADKKFLAERLKLRDAENTRLTQENTELKELAKKNNDINIVTANIAQRFTINLLKKENEELRGRIERAIAKEKDDHNKALENLDKSAKQNQHEWDGHGWIYSRTKVGMHAALDIIAALSNIHSSKIIEILEGKAKEGKP